MKGIVLLLFLQGTLGWNLFAHSVIARIAEADLEKDEKGRAVLAKVYGTLSSLTKFFPEVPDSLLEVAVTPDALNFNFKGFLAKYHYKDIPEVYKNDDPRLPTGEIDSTNADYALESAISIIRDSMNPDQEQKKLIKKGFVDSLMTRYVVHVVGDVHQPLHATSLFSALLFDGKIVNGDAGGNLIPILDPYKTDSRNLHAFWDNGLGLFPRVETLPLDELTRANVRKMAEELTTALPKAFFGKDVELISHKAWIEESYKLASQIVYADIDLFPVIRPEYVVIGRRVSRERVTLAGYRLANLLREVFK